VVDAINEVRELVDFFRFYATQAGAYTPPLSSST